MPDSFDEALAKSKRKVPSFDEALAANESPVPAAPAEEPKAVEPAVTVADIRQRVMGVTDHPVLSGYDRMPSPEVANAQERASHSYLRRAFVDAPGDVADVIGSAVTKGAVSFNEGLDRAGRTATNFAMNAIDRTEHSNPFEDRPDNTPNETITRAREFANRASEHAAERSPNTKAIIEHTDKIGEMAGGIGSSMVLGGANFPLMEALKNPDRPVAAAAEAKVFMFFQGALGEAMAGADPSRLRAAASNAASAYIAGRSSGQSHDEALGAALAFGAKDLATHKAPAKMGVNNPGATATERGTAPVEAARPGEMPVAPEAPRPVEAVPEAPKPAPVAPPEAVRAAPEWKATVENAVANGVEPKAAEALADRVVGDEFDAARAEGARQREAARASFEGERRAEVPPTAEPVPGGEPTSAKNATANRERVERDMGELEKPFKLAFEDVADSAIDTIAANKHKPYDLVKGLTEKPRAISPEETAILTIHKVNLFNARDAARAELRAAEAAGSEEGVRRSLEEVERLHAEMNVVDEATHASGTESGRSLAFRQMMMNRDYSLAEVESSLRESTGYRKMNVEEIDALRKEAETIHGEIAKARAELDAIKAKREEATHSRNIDSVIRSESPKINATEYGVKNKIVTREAYEKTKAELRAMLGDTTVGAFKFLDPTILAKVVKLGAFHIEAGARSFAAWAKSMKSDVGDVDEAELKEIWNASRKTLNAPTLEGVTEKVRERAKAGNVPEMAEIAKLADMFVRHGGIEGREALIDAVHEVLSSANPEITRKDTMVALSRYGQVKRLSTDPVNAKIREYKGEIQQLLKLKDMEEGLAPLKSGVERQPPGPEQRALIKQVNEAKRRGGYDKTDDATEARTALEAIKTRMTHGLEDMKRQIDSGVKDVKNRTKVELDADATALRGQYEAMKAKFDEVFGKPEMSDAQRIAIAEKATAKSIADLQGRLAKGDVFNEKAKDGPTSAKLEELRQEQKALREQMADMRKAASPSMSPIERLIGSRSKRRDARIEELNRRIAAEEFGAKQKEILPPAPEEIAAIAREQEAIKRFNVAKVKHTLENERFRDQAFRVAFKEIPAFHRMFQFGWDLSVTGLQFGAEFYKSAISRDPMRPFRAFGEAWGAMGKNENSLRRTAESEARITSDPLFSTLKRAGLAFSGIGDAKPEEMMRSRWGENTPGLRQLQRFVGTLSNRMRVDSAKALAASMSKTGNPTPEEWQHIAATVNMFTGRSGGKNRHLDSANAVLLAPRWYISRMKAVIGMPMWHGGTARTKIVAAKEYGRLLTGMGVMYALAAATGHKIDDDPTSSGFGDIDFGGTKVNPTLGLSTVATLFARAYVKLSPLSSDRDKRKINDDFVGSHLRGKLIPPLGAAYSLLNGTTLDYGKDTGKRQKATRWNVALGLATPLSLDDIYKTMVQQGAPKGLALGALAIFGIRLRNDRYGPKKK